MLQPNSKNNSSPGLQALVDAGRTDLSVEYAVLKPEFRSLFNDAELAEAQRRLDNLPSYTRRKNVSPELNFSGEQDSDAEFIVGGQKQVTVSVYERDPLARKACLKKFGVRCAVCGMTFEERYGKIGKGFIHVHHKKPLAGRTGKYVLKPTIDLVPVCPNCHTMLHTQNPPLGVDELKKVLEQQKI